MRPVGIRFLDFRKGLYGKIDVRWALWPAARGLRRRREKGLLRDPWLILGWRFVKKCGEFRIDAWVVHECLAFSD
jgi:hypothetical protein